MSLAPTPRLASLSHSLDEGSDNGRHSDLDSPFDLSLARYRIMHASSYALLSLVHGLFLARQLLRSEALQLSRLLLISK